MNIEEQLSYYQELTEKALKSFLESEKYCTYRTIYDAVKYSSFAGGKRLRPALLLEFCRVCGGETENALPFAAALEMVHTYSLIHDDLPCMDDDEIRRGKPTSHKVYGEGMAVLAGDALLTRAFETVLNVANHKKMQSTDVLRATFLLARAAGMDGMIGGQVIDLESEGKQLELSELMELQALKTGCLIEAACTIGCICAGRTDADTLNAARTYGTKVGLAFQIEDDVLDIEGSSAALGKTIGKDAQHAKSTFPALIGLHKCKERIRELTREAVDAVQIFDDPSFLVALATKLVSRDK